MPDQDEPAEDPAAARRLAAGPPEAAARPDAWVSGVNPPSWAPNLTCTGTAPPSRKVTFTVPAWPRVSVADRLCASAASLPARSDQSCRVTTSAVTGTAAVAVAYAGPVAVNMVGPVWPENSQ